MLGHHQDWWQADELAYVHPPLPTPEGLECAFTMGTFYVFIKVHVILMTARISNKYLDVDFGLFMTV